MVRLSLQRSAYCIVGVALVMTVGIFFFVTSDNHSLKTRDKHVKELPVITRITNNSSNSQQVKLPSLVADSTVAPSKKQVDPEYFSKEPQRYSQNFSSLKAADVFIKDMDIDRATIVNIKYYNFSKQMPHFANQEDRDILMINDRVKAYFTPNIPAQLKGVIEVIPNGSFNGSGRCGFRTDYSYYKITRKPASKKFKYLCPLLVPDAFAFQLFMSGTFPKIAQAYNILRRPDVTLLLHEPRDPVITSILNKLGITRDRIIHVYSDVNDEVTTYQADYLITTCITPPLHPIIWRKMRDLMGVHEQLTVPVFNSTVLLLTRAGSRNAGRNIVNTLEMEKILRQRYPGQVHVFTGGYNNVEDAVDFFGKVRIIIGPHGGAFFNMNFAPSSTTIIEFVPHKEGGLDPGHFSPAIVMAMAHMIGQSYWRIPCLRVNAKNNMKADLNKVKQVLDRVDDSYIHA